MDKPGYDPGERLWRYFFALRLGNAERTFSKRVVNPTQKVRISFQSCKVSVICYPLALWL
jgi:hypothetical protein